MKKMLAHRLMNSSSEEVYNILKIHHEYRVWAGYSWGKVRYRAKKRLFSEYEYSSIQSIDSVEILLSKRNDPLINLALAQFSSNQRLLNLFYTSRYKAFRLACLSNPFYIPYNKDFGKPSCIARASFFVNLTPVEIEMFIRCSKDWTAMFLFLSLYEKNGYFESIEEKQWKRYILVSAENWFLSDARNCGSSVIEAALGLLKLIQEPSNEWATIICLVLDKIINAGFHMTEGDVIKILEKWRDIDPGKDEYYHPLRTRIVILSNMSPYLNKNLFQPEIISVDPAVRFAYYQLFYCKDVDTYDKYSMKDNREFLYNVCLNKTLHNWPPEVLMQLVQEIEGNEFLQEKFNERVNFSSSQLVFLRNSIEKNSRRIDEIIKFLNWSVYLVIGAIIFYDIFIHG